MTSIAWVIDQFKASSLYRTTLKACPRRRAETIPLSVRDCDVFCSRPHLQNVIDTLCLFYFQCFQMSDAEISWIYCLGSIISGAHCLTQTTEYYFVCSLCNTPAFQYLKALSKVTCKLKIMQMRLIEQPIKLMMMQSALNARRYLVFAVGQYFGMLEGPRPGHNVRQALIKGPANHCWVW